MTQLLLIDCRTMRAARYEGRRQQPEVLAVTLNDKTDMQAAALGLDAFRRFGFAGLEFLADQRN